MKLAEAREAVKRDAAAAVEPVLSDPEIDGLLQETMRARTWSAMTAFKWRDRVVPTTRTGCYFVNVGGGTSGPTEPDWPDSYGRTVDDGTCKWECRMPDWDELYDLKLATHRAWVLKASKASEYTAVSEDGQSTHDEQIYEHCERMAKRWQPVRIG